MDWQPIDGTVKNKTNNIEEMALALASGGKILIFGNMRLTSPDPHYRVF
jgi:hypothetical protein